MRTGISGPLLLEEFLSLGMRLVRLGDGDWFEWRERAELSWIVLDQEGSSDC